MTDPMMLGLALLCGVVLGGFFFGGLWWTTQRGAASPTPARWFLGSFVVRTGLVLTGFYLVSGGQWERLVACVLGFSLARLGVTHLTRPPGDPAHAGVAPSKEVKRAP